LRPKWINDYFSLPDRYTVDSNHDPVKIYLFNTEKNWHLALPDLELSYAYLHWNLDNIANGYVSEIEKEYQLESKKKGKINSGLNSSFSI
jgi:ABC-type microcin C transport system permease subunit YejB